MEAICEQSKERGAERAALFHASVRRQSRSLPTLYFDRNRSCGIKAADGSQHLPMEAQALQNLPQQRPRHMVKGALRPRNRRIALVSAVAGAH